MSVTIRDAPRESVERKAKIVRPGKDMTLVTYGALVPRALQAAERAARQGADVEVLDLRTLNPYDWEAIATSVRKTSRVIVAHEDMLSWGYGAEIAARIADELFDDLDAPVRRIAGTDQVLGRNAGATISWATWRRWPLKTAPNHIRLGDTTRALATAATTGCGSTQPVVGGRTCR